MMYTLQNEYLTVQIHEKGATPWSIKEADGTEYLWQGDARYWKNRAPHLFPYIGRMPEGNYTVNGKPYHMNIHGFARDMVFDVSESSDTQLVFTLVNNEESYRLYPFAFCLSIIYRLTGRTLSITYRVVNTDDKTMYFGIGAHPGFNVPLEVGETFEDYYLEFDTVADAKRVEFSEACFTTGELTAFPLADGVRLSLTHDLFDKDAIILTDMAKSVTLKSAKGKKCICVSYPDMPYLGVWHMPKTDAPYVCIEPWSSLPSRDGVVEELTTKPGLIPLEQGCEYTNEITFSFESVKGEK